ncbi:hypothetical protein D3C71_1946730 [compost metagenome]
MMRASVSSRSRMGLGPLRIRSTVKSSTFLTSLMLWVELIMFDGGVMMRVRENTTSSAVNGAPSWNLTPLRSSKRHCVGLTSVHLVASAGSS